MDAKVARKARRDQSQHDAANKLRTALYDRRMHSDECPRWDYEATNCDVCDAHDRRVQAARARFMRALAEATGGVA